MYLIDTNIFLEILLEQEKEDVSRILFSKIDLSDMYLSELSLYSIGIILFKLKKPSLFSSFIDDIVMNGINVINYPHKKLNAIKEISEKFSLDFDDAYQYAIAKEYSLTLISFDKDFSKTDLNRKTPNELIL